MYRHSWKEFKETAARRIPDAARVSLGEKGTITFDLATYKRMGEPEAFVLLFEGSTRSIGLKPATSDSPNAVIVRARHPNSNRCINSMPFMRRHNIDTSKTLRFPFPPIHDGVLVLRLSTAVDGSRPGLRKVR